MTQDVSAESVADAESSSKDAVFWPVGRPFRRRRRKRRLWLHVALFLATVASTSLMRSPLYSLCVMSILTAHEFGHYFAARYYGVPASLPFFIPSPFMFGTMGAIIRMSPLIPNRKALFDISAAGPLAGVVLAIPISFVGIAMSERVPLAGLEADSGPVTITLGDTLLFQAFERLLLGAPRDDMVLMLNDVAFAGWVGVFVTALNLLPVGQLDGGHVSHAVFGRYSGIVAWAGFGAMAVVCILVSPQFLLILLLVFLSGIRHRPTLDDAIPLGLARRRVAIVLLVVFAVCFTPTPISIEPFGD